MPVRNWNLLLGALFFCSALEAQSYPLAKCGIPREPLGALHGGGEVRYQLGKNGRPDTTSLAVLSVNGLSVGGFRSAATRQLSACKMARPHGEAGMVRQQLRFDGAQLSIDPATPADTSSAPLAIPAAPLLLAATYADSQVEETPRMIRCARPPEPAGPRERTFTSREEAEAELARDAQRNSGRILTRLVIDTTGRVLADSITILSSDNPGIANNLRTSLASCRYTPARIGGVPVRVAIRRGTGIRVSNEVQFR